MDPAAKAGSKTTIELMTKVSELSVAGSPYRIFPLMTWTVCVTSLQHYPETMKRKLFVNVPLVMGWIFGAMRMILSRETTSKFTMISYGSSLAGEIGHADKIPQAYGGKEERVLKELALPWAVEQKVAPTEQAEQLNRE